MNNMKTKMRMMGLLLFLGFGMAAAQTPPALHVEGRYFVDANGNRVNLHGFAQTYSPWFNEQGTKWTNYNVNACLSYNKGLIDKILDAGWKMDFVRLHMDPYWSNTPGEQTNGESDIHAFDFDRFKKYLDEVFVPMAECMIGKGLYVIMRPPGVCPEHISVGDAYQQYLIKVWGYVAQHPKLKNNGCVMFELANEPIHIYHSDGSRAGDKEIAQYFQAVVDVMRQHCNNILLVPGLGYQAQYAGYVKHRIQGENIGFAIHCYPGWYNGGYGEEVVVNYADFKKGWDEQIAPVSNVAPVVVTEMDWAPLKYSTKHTNTDGTVYYDPRASFAFSTTGVAGGQGFGANFKKLCDDCGNVSWLLFTGAEQLAKYNDAAPDGQTFLTDWEACPRPCYRWYQEYAAQRTSEDYKKVTKVELLTTSCEMIQGGTSPLFLIATYADGHQANVAGDAKYTVADPSVAINYGGNLIAQNPGETTVSVAYTDPQGGSHPFQISVKVLSFFPLTNGLLNPSIIGTGSFNETTGALKTGQYGYGGWQYPDGIDISAYNYLVIELKEAQSAGAVFRMFDVSSCWGPHTETSFGSNTKLALNLHNLKVWNDNAGQMTDANRNLDPSHVYFAGIWSYGSSPIYINKVYLSDDGVNPTGIIENGVVDEIVSREYYTLSGARIVAPTHGICIIKAVTKSGKVKIFKTCYK